MVGDKVTVKLNDKLVADNVVMENYWEREKPIYPTGAIELQNHGNTLVFPQHLCARARAERGLTKSE